MMMKWSLMIKSIKVWYVCCFSRVMKKLSYLFFKVKSFFSLKKIELKQFELKEHSISSKQSWENLNSCFGKERRKGLLFVWHGERERGNVV